MPHVSRHNRSRLFQIEAKISKYTSLTHFVLAMAIIEPLMTLPQIYEIWIMKKAQGVSLLTWAFYSLASVIWLLYGIKIKDKPLIIASGLWVVVELIVVFGLVFV